MAVGFVVEHEQCAAQTDSSLAALAESREGVRTQDLRILRFLAEGLTFDAVDAASASRPEPHAGACGTFARSGRSARRLRRSWRPFGRA